MTPRDTTGHMFDMVGISPQEVDAMTTTTQLDSYVLQVLQQVPRGRALYTRTVHVSRTADHRVVEVFVVTTPPWDDQPDILRVGHDVATATRLPYDRARGGFVVHGPHAGAHGRLVAALGDALHADATHYQARSLG